MGILRFSWTDAEEAEEWNRVTDLQIKMCRTRFLWPLFRKVLFWSPLMSIEIRVWIEMLLESLLRGLTEDARK